jgi:hypothetical protein
MPVQRAGCSAGRKQGPCGLTVGWLHAAPHESLDALEPASEALCRRLVSAWVARRLSDRCPRWLRDISSTQQYIDFRTCPGGLLPCRGHVPDVVYRPACTAARPQDVRPCNRGGVLRVHRGCMVHGPGSDSELKQVQSAAPTLPHHACARRVDEDDPHTGLEALTRTTGMRRVARPARAKTDSGSATGASRSIRTPGRT